jgi:hypothetical protein
MENIHMKDKVLMRFISKLKIDPITGCWEHTGGQIDGFAVINIDNKNQRAHRYAYDKMVGNIPNGMVVRHTCGNKLCCNPKHLYLARKPDYAKGERTASAKLTEEEVLWMRKHRDEFYQYKLADKFCVSTATISKLLSGHTWRHV